MTSLNNSIVGKEIAAVFTFEVSTAQVYISTALKKKSFISICGKYEHNVIMFVLIFINATF